MLDIDKELSVSIPEPYNIYLTPLIFETYAVDLAQGVVGLSPGPVLETVAGTGVVTWAMAALLPPSAVTS